MAFKQKKRVKSTKNKYLRPGDLAQLCYKSSTRSCSEIFKNRTASRGRKVAMDTTVQLTSMDTSVQLTPRPTSVSTIEGSDCAGKTGMLQTPISSGNEVCHTQSSLESLPSDLLVKILCHLHHDQLRAVFHVSQRIRTAVLLARHLHFNYTTPDRTRQEMLNIKTPLPTERWPFRSLRDSKKVLGSGPLTPKAPRHGPRPTRLRPIDMKQVAAVLFQEHGSSKVMVPTSPAPIWKPVAPSRVLFCEEDELCHAVAQNKLS